MTKERLLRTDEQVIRRNARQHVYRLHLKFRGSAEFPFSFGDEPAYDPPDPLGPRAKLQSTDELWRVCNRCLRVV